MVVESWTGQGSDTVSAVQQEECQPMSPGQTDGQTTFINFNKSEASQMCIKKVDGHKTGPKAQRFEHACTQ